MKKHFKTLRERGLALFLAFVMCFSLLPAQAMAQDAGTAGAENTYSICDNADNCIQQLQEWLNGKAAGTSISIEVQADIWFNQTLNIPAGLDVTVYANDGTIRRDTEGGFSCPMFSVPAGAKLTLRNVTIESRDKTNNTPDSGASMVVVNGGECVLGSGAKLAEGRFYNGDGPKKGGAVYLDGGKFTMQKGSTIEHCGAKDAGGAVYVAKGEFIAESGATIGECWVGTQKQGTKVYVAEGATFKNAAGIDGVRDANDNLPDQFVDEWLVITILRNNPNSNGIPSEPSTVGGCTWDHLMKSNDGYTIATTGDQWNLTFTKNPAEVVKTEILNSPEYIASTNVNDHAWGVADSTGVKTKEWLKLDEAFWSKYLDVLARENRYQVIGANNVLTDTLNNANKEQYKVVPYVVKYQDNGNNYDGWHIDCAVIPKDSLQLTYNLNLPNGVSTNTSGFGLPLTVIGIPGAETVEAKPVGTLYFNNAQVTPVDSDGTTDSATPIRAKYQNEDITLLFKGWSTTPDGIGQSLYRPGADASFNETTTLYAQWTQTPPFSITYDGLENSTFADNNPNPTSYSIVTPTFTLRNPTKEGYKFLGWTGTGLDRATETVTIEQGSTGNRSYTATWEAIKAAKLSVSKVAKVNGVEVTEAKPGQTITYTITVTNSGNGAAEKVLLKDVFSGTGLVWTSDDPTAKEFGVAAQGETGDTVEFTATYEVQESDAGKKITNSAVLKDDPAPTTPQTTVEVKAAKLSVSKVAKVNGVEVTEAKPGQTITYTITVTNSGNGAAEKVLLKDVFSGTGLVWTSDDPTAKEFGVAAQGETGDTVEFTATYEVQESDAGKKITNSAVLKDDPDPTTPQTTVEVKAAKLAVSKSATNAVKVGENIVYTIIVENTGTAAANNVAIYDLLDSSVEFKNVTLNGADVRYTFNAETNAIHVAVGNLVPGDKAELVITTTANAAGTVTNKANASSKETGSKDSNVVTTTVTEDIPVVPELTIAKDADKTSAKLNDVITFSVKVTNSGNVVLTDVIVADPMMENGQTVIPSLAAGAEQTITYTHTVTAGDVAAGKVSNTATVSGTNPNGEDPADKTVTKEVAVTDVPVQNPELTIVKTADRTVAKLGDIITYTITVENSGNVALTNITLSDPMMTLAGVSGEIGELDAGEIDVTTYTHTVTETDVLAGQVINTATVSGTNPDGPAPKEETSTVVVTIPDQAEKINVTWVDGYNGDILKELPGVYDKGTTTIPKDQYPSVPAHAGYTFEQWTSQVLGNGDIIITANYRTLEVNPGGPSFEDLTNLGITVEVVCDTNATHGPETRSYPLMEGSYETFVANGSCTLVIYNDLYVEAYGGDHSLVGRPAQTIMLEYVGTPAPISDDETAGDETIDAGSNADSEDESTDNVVDNNVDNDADVTTPDAGAEAGSEDSGITDTSSEETGNGNLIDDDSGDEAGAGDGNVDAGLLENDINNDEPIQLMSVEAISFSAPTVTGRWAIAEGYTNTVTFYVRCEEPAARTHTVTWVNWNGDVLQQMDNVANDVNIPSSAYTNATPVRPADAGYTYTFSGWSAPSVDANGNVTYTALYDRTAIVRTHTVTWVNWNGIVLQQMDNVANGVNIPSSAYTNATPVRPADAEYTYTFSGWSAPSVDRDGNVTYVAQYTPSRIPEEGPVVPVPPVTPVTPVTPTPGPTVIPDNPTPLDPGTTITDDDVPLAGAVGLNDVDHFAYIIGYDEDHVRPLNNITRAEVATIFFRLMTDEYRNANWSTSNDFSDVQAGSWYNNAISTCANAGALNGYADGSFKPNASITRAEFAAIAARFLSDEYTDDGTGDFSDTANHWAAKEIRLAAKAGWVRGDGNKFRPNDPITRAEVMTIVNRMLDRVPDADHMLETMKKWVDNPEDAWYYEAVQEATNEHAYERDADLGVIETWTEILEVRDWKALEESWANANT